MPVRKYSRQRECIKSFLMTRKDHPTADTIYENVRMVRRYENNVSVNRRSVCI